MIQPAPSELLAPSALHLPDDLWRDFPKTATKFEARFASEDNCRAYWRKARWGDKPAGAACGGTRVWMIRKSLAIADLSRQFGHSNHAAAPARQVSGRRRYGFCTTRAARRFTILPKSGHCALIHASPPRVTLPLDRSARGDVTGGDHDGEAVTGPGVKPAW
jgi:hypothetical protein